MKEIKHHWLGQADAELHFFLLLLQKIYVCKFSAEEVEPIIHNIIVWPFTACFASFKYIDQY